MDEKKTNNFVGYCEVEVVENAEHFSFLSPLLESMTRSTFLLSQDPIGFNRRTFHHELNAEVLEFLLRET